MRKTKRLSTLTLAIVLLPGLFAGLPQAALAASADITTKFTDAKFKAAVYDVIGKKAPTPILDTDLAGVETLLIYEKDLQNLAGLEYFTGLKKLDCSYNRLVSLPILPPGLEWLNCTGNQLTSLPALPSGLGTLECGGNKLAELPSLPNRLWDLECSFNQLTSLPNLPNSLRKLKCNGNQLTELDLSNINILWELDCSRNRLAELVVNAYSSLTLRALYCSRNDMEDPSAVKGFSKDWNGENFIFYPQNNMSFPSLSGLSPWAVKEADSLNARCIIPSSMQNNYQKPIRRDEFTALLINTIEYTWGRRVPVYSTGTYFDDVADSPYKDAIEKATLLYLIDGTSPKKFSPYNLLTREQAAKLLYTMVEGRTELDSVTPDFTDSAKISDWALPYVAYCQKNNIIQGSSTGRFDPKGNLTREQAMLVFERLIVQYDW